MNVERIKIFLIFCAVAAQAASLPKLYVTYLDYERMKFAGELNPYTGELKKVLNLIYLGKGPVVFGAAAFDPLQKIYYSAMDSGEIEIGNMTNYKLLPKINFGLDAGIRQAMFDSVNRRLLVTKMNSDGPAVVLSSDVNGTNYKWNTLYTLNFECCSEYNSAYHFDSEKQIYSFINSPQTSSTSTYLYQISINTGKEVARVQLNDEIAGFGAWEFQGLEYDPQTNTFVAFGVQSSGQLQGSSIAIINSNGIQNMYKVTPLGADTPLFMKFDANSRTALVFLRSLLEAQTYIIGVNVDSGQIVWTSPYIHAYNFYNAVWIPDS